MSETTNPFSTLFGLMPDEYISRNEDYNRIIKDFSAQNTNQRIYVISGVRGSGKTVFLSEISSYFSKEDDWVCVDISPDSDMLQSLASSLYDKCKVKHLFTKANLNISYSGIGFSIERNKPISSVDSVLDLMFQALKKQNKKVLITIDDVANTPNMRIFAHSYQRFLREKYNVFLLMTGIFNNINNLERSKTMTFLVRAPKIELSPLYLISIASSYEKTLKISEADSIRLAKFTKGYAYAYQLLGSLLFDGHTFDNNLIAEFDIKITQTSYSYIWDELSEKEKIILKNMNKENNVVSEVIDKAGIDKSQFAVYRDRLIKRGVLSSPKYGTLEFALPRFYEFVQKMKLWEE